MYAYRAAGTLPPLGGHYGPLLVPTAHKYLILSMVSGSFVRDAGRADVQLKAEEVNGSYLLLNGIDYMSNYQDHKLIYMEV